MGFVLRLVGRLVPLFDPHAPVALPVPPEPEESNEESEEQEGETDHEAEENEARLRRRELLKYYCRDTA